MWIGGPWGWVPHGSDGNPNIDISADVDDARMHFGHLRVSDAMEEESQRFQTQTTDDDFCEVIVRPRQEPLIEDKPQSAKNDNPQPSVTENGNATNQNNDDVQDDVFVAAKETEEEIEGSSDSEKPEENGKVEKAAETNNSQSDNTE